MITTNCSRWFAKLFAPCLFVASILVSSPSVFAQIDASINQMVWQNLYGVRNNQLYVNGDSNQGLNTVWLNADDDGDGLSNGLELAAGTNPFSLASMLRIKGVTSNASTLSLTSPTVAKKLYIAQTAIAQTPLNWQPVTPSVQVVGDGTDQTLTVLKSGTNGLFRVLVQDQSSASDQISDWAKQALGLNPNSAIGSQSGYADHTALSGALKSQSTVTVSTVDAATTMPADGVTAATDLGVVTISRGGYLLLNSITVPLLIAGTAQPGVDYSALPSSVTLPSGVKSLDLKITPLYNANQKTNTTVTVTLLSGGGYTVGSPSKASVTIYPSQTPIGTGLTGKYLVGGSTTWSNALFTGTAALTRVDPIIDFSTAIWGHSLSSPITTTNYKYVVRWTGQVQPQYSETYYFDVKSADGVKLWVNGQLIIDKWQSQSVSDQISLINLQAGVFYDIQLDYLQNGSSSHPAEVHLNWYSNSQVKQIIPTNRLYPYVTGVAGAAPPAITSAPATVAYLNQPFSFNITASNVPTTFGLTPGSVSLPAGLSLNTSTGLISGTATTAGDYPLTVQATNGSGTGSAGLDIMVLNTGNAMTREIWNNLGGANISDLNAAINGTPAQAPLAPNSTDTVTNALEDTTSYADNTGERLRGYFTAPSTGNYYFWISANNAAQLWISDNAEPASKVLRATVTSPGTSSRIWNAQTNQQSQWLSLIGGQKYYVEVLHNTGADGTKNLSVAWFKDPTGNTANPIANGSGAASGIVGGLIPAYVLWPWDNPPTLGVPGSIYTANLQAVSGINSTAVGSAYVRANGNSAIVHLNYFGLTSGIISRRIYAMPIGVNPPQLLFDLDAQDKLYPNLRTSDNGYTWNMQPSDSTVLTSGSAFLSIGTANNPGGEIAGLFGLIAGSQASPAIPNYPAWTDDHGTDAGASRFLTQATFGPSPTDMAYVKANGYRAWIENQFAIPIPTHTAPYLLANVNSDPTNPYPSTLTFNAWWQNAITAPDQLRQKLAFALSEIVVVSDAGVLNNNGPALSHYYDMLLDNAYGNFKGLLKQVSLSPTMGAYLDMLQNDLGDITVGRHPNENYAREIMQLFSIGLYRLWPDGTLVLDSNGNPMPTYDQTVITGMARVFTGWSWDQPLQGSGRLSTNFYPSLNYVDPMVLVPTHHELGSKILLDNVLLPPAVITNSSDTTTDPTSTYTVQTTDPALGQGNLVTTTITNRYDLNGLKDFEASMGSLFNHSNVGPLVCRELIQRLVTSNPKPAYVNRVVRAFNGEQNVDGVATGVRGDMKDVIRAILLDYEARSSTAAQDIGFGKQREPLLRVTGPARSFPSAGLTTSGTSIYPLSATYRETGGQTILVTSTVPHRLSNGDYVLLDFGTGASNLPTTQSYQVAMPGYSFDKPSGIATIQAPGYQPNDSVTLQFTSGNLNVSPYNTVRTYSVLSSTATTTSAFAIQVATPNAGPTTGNGSTLMPYSFTINAGTNFPSSYGYTVSGTTVTVAGSSYVAGNQAWLQFTSGGLQNAGYDGIYPLLTTTGSNFTIGLSSTPASSVSGSCLIPKLSAGYVVTVSGSTSTITVSTVGNHNLSAGNSVYLHFVATQVPNVAQDGLYVIPANGIIDNGHFAVTTTSAPTLTPTSQGTSALFVYPLIAPPINRSGNVTINQGTWQMNYTTGDSSTNSIGQTPLDSPTVFNFFYPGYQYPGEMAAAGMTTPEFQISGDTTTLSLTNYINSILSASNANGLLNFKSTPAPIVLDVGPYMTPALTTNLSIPALVDTLSTLLTGGNLQPGSKTFIVNYVQTLPYTTPTNSEMRDRVRSIVHLILVSAEYAIQK